MTSPTAPTPALHPATLAAHGGSSVADPYRDLAPPLHLSTTFERAADGSYPGGRVYSRDQSPAYDGVELLLAEPASMLTMEQWSEVEAELDNDDGVRLSHNDVMLRMRARFGR